MRKIYSFLFALLAFAGLAQAQVTFVAGTDKYSTDQPGAHTLTKDGVTIAVSNGTLGRTDNYRVYKNQTLTVSSTATITSIVFTCTSSNPISGFDVIDGLTVDGNNGTWAGSATSVVLTASSKQVQMTKIEVYLDGEAPVEPTPVEPTPTPGAIDWTSSLDAPLTVAQTLEKAAQLEAKAESDKDVYVKGIVSQVDDLEINANTGQPYGNLTYYISDDGTTAEQFQIFRGYGLDGAQFTADNLLKVGDNVIVLGKVKNYVDKNNVSTLEMNQGSKIVKLNDQTVEPTPTPTPTPGGGKGTGTLEDPYNYEAAAAAASALSSGAKSDDVYIKGKISEIKYAFDKDHGTATFFITDDGNKAANQFQVFGTYYLGNRAWTDGDTQIAVGDEVIIFGKVTNYQGTTPETASKESCLYSLNGKTASDVPGITYTEYNDLAAAKAAAPASQTEAISAQLNLQEVLVTYVNGQSLYIFDGTDGLLVYGANKDIKAGDKISGSIKGQLYKRYGATQLSNPVYEVTVASNGNEVAPQEITADVLVGNIADYENELVKLTGMLPAAEAWESQNVTFTYRDKARQTHTVVLRDNWKVATTMSFNTETAYELTGFPVKYIDKENNEIIQLYPRSMEDIDNGEAPVVYEFTGDGSLEKPYTVADMQHISATSTQEAAQEGKWVKGYIAGYINGSSLSATSAIFSAEAPEGTDKDGNPLSVTVSNIILADAAGASTVAAVIPVGLYSNTPARTDLNLKDNPAKYGTQVWVKGDVYKYMGVTGLKNVKEYSLDGVITTAVRSLDAAAAPARDIFNLAGQRVQNLNKRGLYIINGQKVVVK